MIEPRWATMSQCWANSGWLNIGSLWLKVFAGSLVALKRGLKFYCWINFTFRARKNYIIQGMVDLYGSSAAELEDEPTLSNVEPILSQDGSTLIKNNRWIDFWVAHKGSTWAYGSFWAHIGSKFENRANIEPEAQYGLNMGSIRAQLWAFWT